MASVAGSKGCIKKVKKVRIDNNQEDNKKEIDCSLLEKQKESREIFSND